MNAILLAVLAGLCWGVGELFTKSVLHTGKVGPLTAIAVRSTIALPALWLAYWFAMHVTRSEPREWLKSEPAILLKLVLGSGLIAGAAGMICFYAALHAGEISRVKPIAFSVAPAAAVLLGWMALGETMTLQKALALLLIVAGVILLTSNSSAATVPVQ